MKAKESFCFKKFIHSFDAKKIETVEFNKHNLKVTNIKVKTTIFFMYDDIFLHLSK